MARSAISAFTATLTICILVAGISIIPNFANSAPAEEKNQGVAEVLGGLKVTGDEAFGTTPPLSLPVTIGKFINVFLSFLGIIFFAIVIYAGFLYLTASGEEDKVKKAKKMLSTAIIGLVIIIAAYTIADFVIDNLVAAVATP